MDKNQEQKYSIGVILLAAGSSSRMNGDDKIFIPIFENPLLFYSLTEFHRSPLISSITIVLNEKNLDKGTEYIKSLNLPKVKSICKGGLRRQDSVLNGLNTLGEHDYILIHDAARPCIDQSVIERGIETVITNNAAIPVIPSTDTLRTLSGDNYSDNVIDRQKVWATQTPQCFSYTIILRALNKNNKTVTDEAILVQKLGVKVKTFLGSKTNIKITTEDDIPFIKSILKGKIT